MPQRAAVAQRAVQVASAPAGVIRDGHQSGRGSKVTGAGEGAQVTSADQQRGAEEGTEAGHGLDDLGLRMFGERLLDLGIEDFQSFVEGEDAAGQLGDDARRQLLAWQYNRLGFGRADGA